MRAQTQCFSPQRKYMCKSRHSREQGKVRALGMLGPRGDGEPSRKRSPAHGRCGYLRLRVNAHVQAGQFDQLSKQSTPLQTSPAPRHLATFYILQRSMRQRNVFSSTADTEERYLTSEPSYPCPKVGVKRKKEPCVWFFLFHPDKRNLQFQLCTIMNTCEVRSTKSAGRRI